MPGQDLTGCLKAAPVSDSSEGAAVPFSSGILWIFSIFVCKYILISYIVSGERR